MVQFLWLKSFWPDLLALKNISVTLRSHGMVKLMGFFSLLCVHFKLLKKHVSFSGFHFPKFYQAGDRPYGIAQ